VNEPPNEVKAYEVVERKIGIFNEVVAVVRANKQNFTMKVLVYGKSVLGGVWEVPDNPSIFTVFLLMDLPVYATSPQKHALIIGLGIGHTVKAFNEHNIISDVIEIDPFVVEFARKHFGFTTQGEVHTEDALVYLEKDLSNKLGYYDIIVHDVFSGSLEPRLFTLETLQKLDILLNKDGMLVLNYLGKKDSGATLAVLRTLRTIWQHVRCFADVLESDGHYPIGNLVFFASHKEVTFDTPKHDPSYAKYTHVWMLSHHAELEVFFDTKTEGPIVTNQDYTAIILDQEFKDYFAKSMVDLFPEKMWEDILSFKN